MLRADEAARIAALDSVGVYLEFHHDNLEAQHQVETGHVPGPEELEFMRSALYERALADQNAHYGGEDDE